MNMKTYDVKFVGREVIEDVIAVCVEYAEQTCRDFLCDTEDVDNDTLQVEYIVEIDETQIVRQQPVTLHNVVDTLTIRVTYSNN